MTIARRLPSVLWLTVVWVLLWGTFTPASIVGGVLVAVLVTALFRVPLAADRLRLRPLQFSSCSTTSSSPVPR
jgi:multicomponent Na+:H+ antiporter subunit E